MDYYCERTDLTFWSEPINALTNLGFIIAGLIACYLLNKSNHLLSTNRSIKPTNLWQNDLILLPIFMIIIGIGSFLFHTFATRWAMLADIIPIYIFQIIFLWAYFRKGLKFNKVQAGVGFVLFIVAAIMSKLLPISMNGSEMYLPAIATLIILSGLAKLRRNQVDYPLLLASGFFSLSLTMRTIDEQICQQFPLGTHFGWHLFNSAVLFLSWYSLFKLAQKQN